MQDALPVKVMGKRLIGWKAIGTFLGCDARTARRWEGTRGMPVHRIPGTGIPAVWADPDELTLWLRNAGREADAEPVASPIGSIMAEPDRVHNDRRRLKVLLACAAISTVAIAGGMRIESQFSPARAAPPGLVQVGPYDDDGDAREHYLNARYELGTRSAQGVSAAIQDFRALTLRFPRRAAAYSGLADAYVLSREFGAVPDSTAFPKAARAARIALALAPDMADAWLNRAYVDFWWQHDTSAGTLAFRRALKLAPASAKAHHWYATASVAIGRLATARYEIRRARELDPDNHAIVADAAFIELCAGTSNAAIAALEAMVRVDPTMISAHRYLAMAYLIVGRDADYLREAQVEATLRGKVDQLVLNRQAVAQFRSGGRSAMIGALFEAALSSAERGRGSWLEVANYRALQSDWPGVEHWLAVAKRHHEPDLAFMVGDPLLVGWYRHLRELNAQSTRFVAPKALENGRLSQSDTIVAV